VSADLTARRESDARSRRFAQTEFARPLAIEAGAGTGKTAILVARVLAWCLGPGWERAASREPDAEPARIAERAMRGVVAITFTEAAAAEMAARIERGLALLERGETPVGFEAPAKPERVAALRSAVDQLVVETIHAYCRRLLASHPIEAELHPFFEVDADGRAAAAAVRDAVTEQIGAAYARGDESALSLAGLRVGPRELEEVLVAQRGAGVRAAELAADPLAPERVEALRVRLCAAHDALAAVADRVASVRRGSASAVPASLAAARAYLSDDLERMREGVLAAWEGAARNRLVAWAKGNFSQAERDACGDRCAAIEEAAARLAPLLAHLDKLDPSALAPLARTLGALASDAEERLRRSGHVSFEELLTRAVDLLTCHPQVAADVRRGIDQLLVDEFQDTDARQCAIVAALALEGSERPGLFLVGDPKQSIYGWRNADLEAYEAMLARVRGAGGLVGSLCVNHRSVPTILAEVERVVAPVMVRAPALQPAFEALAPSAAREMAEGFTAGGRAPVEYWLPARCANGEPCTARAADAAEFEARALARDLREIHDAHGVAWRDVGVLFRSRGDWDVYLSALRAQGIPYAVEGDRTYYRRREIIDAASFVCCVLDPNDQLALVALLRSSAAGIPDAAWIPLWEAGFPALAARLGAVPDALAQLEPVLHAVASAIEGSVPGLERIAGWQDAALACLEAVDALRRSFDRDAGDVFVERLRAAVCFEAGEAARFLGAWRAVNLELFFSDLADSLASGEATGALLRRIRRAVAEEETPSAEPAAPGWVDAVTVVTLHGAKGLDWEHVYLMQLHKGEARTVAPGEVGRVDGALESTWCGRPTLAFDVVRERRRRIADAERVRTLYVGMTRARSRLVLSGLWPQFAERGGAESHAALLGRRLPAPPDWSAVARGAVDGRAEAAGAHWVIPALLPPPATSEPVDEPGEPEPVALEPDLAVPVAPDVEPRMLRALGTTVTALAAAPEEAAVSARALPSVGSLVGTAIHAALERFDLGADPHAEWTAQRSRIEAELRASAPVADRARAVEDALACWDAFASGPLAARLLGLGSRVVARELPLLLSDGLGFATGSIDLLYRDEDGGFAVVDYKTDRTEPGADPAARARYARQGALYCRAVSEALACERPPRFEIWWLRSGTVEVIA
jgi:ATP-dependent exoDNAse (exonuclease V) beta subunit